MSFLSRGQGAIAEVSNAHSARKRRINASTANKNITVPLMPVFVIAVLVGFVAIFTKWGIAAALSFWFVFLVALQLWAWDQGRRARREITSRIELSGGRVVKINYRYLRLGPFSLWNSSRSQHVYRVVARDPSGRERIVWARWGRRWFWNPDTLELEWEN